MCDADVAITVADAVQIVVNEQVVVTAAREAIRVGIRRHEPGWLNQGQTLSLSIHIADDQQIQRLNRDYRGIDRPTDVLSFSFVDDRNGPAIRDGAASVVQLGEIVISQERATIQAQELGHSLSVEMAWLTIHGSLHLLGYEHETDAGAEDMEKLERSALRQLGFTVE